jgi:hypothetical protein
MNPPESSANFSPRGRRCSVAFSASKLPNHLRRCVLFSSPMHPVCLERFEPASTPIYWVHVQGRLAFSPRTAFSHRQGHIASRTCEIPVYASIRSLHHKSRTRSFHSVWLQGLYEHFRYENRHSNGCSPKTEISCGSGGDGRDCSIASCSIA